MRVRLLHSLHADKAKSEADHRLGTVKILTHCVKDCNEKITNQSCLTYFSEGLFLWTEFEQHRLPLPRPSIHELTSELSFLRIWEANEL